MSERLVVVAPHPDDEALGAGGLMAVSRDRGTEVFVIFLTVGDGFVEDAARYYLSLDVTNEEYLHLGYERQSEAVRAMQAVGVPADHIFFLGFPDGGLDALWRTHWDGDPFTSRTTEQSGVPYLGAWRPNLPYTGRALHDSLVEILSGLRPDRVVVPSAFDTHPDHWATNAFATLACETIAAHNPAFGTIDRWGYLVHWPAWPFPLVYRPDEPFDAPKPLIELRQEPWCEVSVARGFVEQKRRALLAHESQSELIKPFMMAFCRSTEMFAQENQFEAIPDRGGVLVANSRANWRNRMVRRAVPLIGVRYGRGREFDFAEVMVKDGAMPENFALEVCLNSVDDPPRHYQWTSDSPPDGASVQRGRGVVTLSWPHTWIDESRRVMAGVQLWVENKCEGKIPFRPLTWPKTDSA